jgi:predicted lipoprotein with Yx(FWY)xxD motif
MSRFLRSAAVCSALALLALTTATPLPAAAVKQAEIQTDLPTGILLTRIKLGDGPVVPNAANSAAGRAVVLAIRGFSAVGRVLVGFTDAELRPFYTLPADCLDDCLTRWRPAPASAQAQPLGDWTIVARSDGARQWAFRDKPVYTFLKEKEFKDNVHFYYTRETPGRVQQVAGTGVDGAVVAEADPGDRMKLPIGVRVVENLTAPGMILASGPISAPIYTYTGTAAEERGLPREFRPYPASMADQPLGEFNIRTLPDGLRQWTFRNQPLFTFDGDIEPRMVNGPAAAKGMVPAVVFRFYTPPEIVVRHDERSRGLLTEAKTGNLLYVRDRLAGGGGRFGPERLDPLVGKAIGITGCDRACEKEWKPLIAPKDAQPRGHWTLYDRPDGTKQWAYRTYALYTHPSDPKDTIYGTELAAP